MLAHEEIIEACPAAGSPSDEPAESDAQPDSPDEADSSDEKGRGVPAHVRKLAREAATGHDMTLAEFLAEVRARISTSAPRCESRRSGSGRPRP